MVIPLPPIGLHAGLITLGSPSYQAILEWPFGEKVFYEGQVTRLLGDDIPRRSWRKGH